MKEFCQQLANIVEVENLSGCEVLSEFPAWDSLSVLSVIATIDSVYGVSVTAAEIREASTAAGLWQLIEKRKNS
jgi:acyl carrier protein